MTVTHEDLREGRLNIYQLTGSEAKDLVDEYDRLRQELEVACHGLHRQARELSELRELLTEAVFDASVASNDWRDRVHKLLGSE